MCDIVCALFNTSTLILQPLLIMNLGYWWILDFVGLLPITKRYNKYVLMMIEHFSKCIELVTLLNKFSARAPMLSLTGFFANFDHQPSKVENSYVRSKLYWNRHIMIIGLYLVTILR